MAIFAGDVPVYHHSWNIGNRKRGDELAVVLGQASAVLLKGHGAVTVADSIESIFMVSNHLEQGARMSFDWFCQQALLPVTKHLMILTCMLCFYRQYHADIGGTDC